MQQLSGLDSLYLYTESSRAPLEVSTLWIYDPSTAPNGSVKFEDIVAAFEHSLDRSKVFRRKLVEVPLHLDHPYWVNDDNFDLGYHIRHIALPKPGNWQQLMAQVARLQSSPLDKSRPLWEVYVIERLDRIEGIKRGSFAVFMKMHHATIDGATGRDIAAAIHGLDAKHHSQATWEPEDPPRPLSLVAKSPANNLKKSKNLLKGLVAAAPGFIKAKRESGAENKLKAPATLFNSGRVSSQRLVDGRLFDLAEVKRIRAAVPGTTVNDVVFAVIGGAMRKYLQAKGALPEESMIAACPIDARTDEDQHLDTMVSMMQASLCTDIDDPVQRLRGIHQSTTQAKAHTEAIGLKTMTEIPMNLPAPLAKKLFPAALELAARAGTVQYNTMITNVAGIQKPMYLCGARMVCMLGMGPVTDQMGLFHAVFSYHGGISITATACKEMIPDIEFYSDCIGTAYQELKDSALPRKRTSVTPRRKKTTKRKRAVAI